MSEIPLFLQDRPISASAPAGERPRPHRRSGGHVPGEIGIWVFIFGDMLVFGVFFGVFLHARADDPGLFTRSSATLNQAFGAVNTLLLITSSLLVVTGVRAIRRRQHRIATGLFAGAVGCALGFSVIKVVEYVQKLEAGLTPGTNEFFLYFFAFTGIHWLHLLIGSVLLLLLWQAARRRAERPGDLLLIECGASYWHMVDLLWVVLFPLVYLAPTP